MSDRNLIIVDQSCLKNQRCINGKEKVDFRCFLNNFFLFVADDDDDDEYKDKNKKEKFTPDTSGKDK